MVFGTAQTEPTDRELRNRQLARKAAAEGIVLLENDGILPLAKPTEDQPTQIALYGSGARMTVKGGTGSGAVRERYSVNVEDGLKAKGYNITSTSWLDRFDQFYRDTYKAYEEAVEEKVKGIQDFFQILSMAGKFDHPTGIPVTEEDVTLSDTDTAVYVLARQAGEGNDRASIKGDYLLDDLEIENLKMVSANYKNFILVINVGGMIDLSILDEIHISAVVYMCQGGEEGGNALADILCGDVNSSGKLATTWAGSFDDIPSNTTYSYLGEDEFNQEYNEGIYVGYRYYDTFNVKPKYHFGYGLSYSRFTMEVTSVAVSEENVDLTVSISNTGIYDGKEVVQIYATVPFGKGAEKQRLVAFKKTTEIPAGGHEELNLQFPVEALTIYDEEMAAYILQEGDYLIRVGNSSDNTEIAAVLHAACEVAAEQCVNVCPVDVSFEEIVPPVRAKEKIDNVETFEIPVDNIETKMHNYHTSEVSEEAGVSDQIQALVDSMTEKQLATLVCGGGTQGKRIVAALGASGSTTAELYEELGIPNVVLSDGPAGLNLTSHIVVLEDGTCKAAKVQENFEAYKRYFFGFAKIALTSQMADPADGTLRFQYTTAWPCSQLLAQTFNEDLLFAVGDAIGDEMDEFGVTVWLAPGMNIHRNPLCGRTFEYYSEDPLVSGKMAAAVVRGVQKHPGKGISIKHFAANNCELNRNESSSNVKERALREIYLKGFEIAVKESAPMTVMASYNMINHVYSTNSEDLLVKVLRNEWGFEGLVMSDWDAMKGDREDPMKALTGDVTKAHSAQCDLVMPGRPEQVEVLCKGMEQGSVNVEDLKRSAYRILRMIKENTVIPFLF